MFEATPTATVPVTAFETFVRNVNPKLSDATCTIARDTCHDDVEARVIDFIFTTHDNSDVTLERVVAFSNGAMDFSYELIQGLFFWESDCQHSDPDQLMELTMERRSEKPTNWRQCVYKESFENNIVSTSLHNSTNMRASHLGRYRKCTCNAKENGVVSFVYPSDFKASYDTYLCLCKYSKDGLWNITGEQNFTVATCYANIPVLTSIPKDAEKRRFDALAAARRTSFVGYLMLMKNILGCHKNGVVRWFDAYISPDLSAVVDDDGTSHDIFPHVDVTVHSWTPERDLRPFLVTTNAVVSLAQDVRASFQPDIVASIRIFKVVKAIRWRLLLLSLSRGNGLEAEVRQVTELSTGAQVRWGEDKFGGKLETDSDEDWVQCFLFIFNPLLTTGLNLRTNQCLDDCSEFLKHALTFFLYASYGCNPLGAGEALSVIESIALGEVDDGRMNERKVAAAERFRSGSLYASVWQMAEVADLKDVERTERPVQSEHQGSSRWMPSKDIEYLQHCSGIVLNPPKPLMASVTLKRDPRPKIRFNLQDVEYEARTGLNRLHVRKVSPASRVKEFTYRIVGLTACGVGVTMAHVPREDTSVTAIANGMLSGEAGEDAADWLFRKILFGEVKVSDSSPVCYIPSYSKTQTASAPVINAELAPTVCMGHSAWVFENGVIIPTQGAAPDLRVHDKGLGFFHVTFLEGEKYEQWLGRRKTPFWRGVVASKLPLSTSL